MDRDAMKREAVSRMKKIGIDPTVIIHFENYGNIFVARDNEPFVAGRRVRC